MANRVGHAHFWIIDSNMWPHREVAVSDHTFKCYCELTQQVYGTECDTWVCVHEKLGEKHPKCYSYSVNSNNYTLADGAN